MESIRDATAGDFRRLNEIYNWCIVDNHVSFDTEPFTIESRTAWWEARDPELTCLVAEVDGEIRGLSYSSWYRPKAAYRSTVETTIVLDTLYLGGGLGTRLLSALLERLRADEFRTAVAIVALPNDGSIALHHKLGYRTVGVLHDAGFKLGRHWDTEILEHRLN
ncbi:MAG: phosphinothricin acetyltransferase [Candidatus Poriferisodalaceae bacterium]|jgi:phosphinothricin acetyltransferase